MSAIVAYYKLINVVVNLLIRSNMVLLFSNFNYIAVSFVLFNDTTSMYRCEPRSVTDKKANSFVYSVMCYLYAYVRR